MTAWNPAGSVLGETALAVDSEEEESTVGWRQSWGHVTEQGGASQGGTTHALRASDSWILSWGSHWWTTPPVMGAAVSMW